MFLVILSYRRKQIHSSESETSFNTLESDTGDSIISEIIDAESNIELPNSSDENGKTSRTGKNTRVKFVCLLILFFVLFFVGYDLGEILSKSLAKNLKFRISYEELI